jgi:midasin
VVLEGLEGGPAAGGAGVQLRAQLAAAAGAVLCFDVAYRRSVAQGGALVGFLPHMQPLRGADSQLAGTTTSARDLAQVAAALQQQAHALLLPVLTDMLASPQRQQLESAGTAAVTAALKAAAGAVTSRQQQQQLLPARAMVSTAARQMQQDLQLLLQLAATQEQGALAAAALGWLLQASIGASGSTAGDAAAAAAQQQQQLAVLEASLGRYLDTSAAAACQGSAAACVPLQQLAWLVSSMLDARQRLPQAQQQLLLQQVMPGLVHDALFNWQAGLWAGAQGVAAAHQASPSGGARQPAQPLGGLAGPASHHVAARTVAALHIRASTPADSTSKAARLQQLSLAVEQLLRGAATCCSPLDDSSAGGWHTLALLLAQLLFAHVGSFRQPADVQQLLQLLVQLLAGAGFNSSGGGGDRQAAQQWLQQLGALLSRSSHSTLHNMHAQLLQPLAEAVLLQGLLRAPEQQQQQPQPWYAGVAQQGWAWLLLGCARLQLVAPPPGVDPAGKHGYKAAALARWVAQQLDGDIHVLALSQQVPGGLDGLPQLQQLLAERASLAAQLRHLRTRCVPRPEPPQYQHLQQEVAAFSGGMASTRRLLEVGRSLLHTAQHVGGADVASSAAHEAELWQSSAGGWCRRMQAQFADYSDVLQPVLLAVMEARHGLALLAAAGRAALQAGSTATSGGSGDVGLLGLTAGLLSFPPVLAHTQHSSSSSSSSSSVHSQPVVSASALACPAWQAAAGAAVLQQRRQQLQQHGERPEAAATSADIARFSWQLQCAHTALVVSVQELLAAGPAAAAASAPDAGLARVHSLLAQLVAAWQSVKEFEAQAAAEAAQLFKHKTQTSKFLTEEVCVCPVAALHAFLGLVWHVLVGGCKG